MVASGIKRLTLHTYLGFVTRRPLIVLSVVVLATLVLAWHLPRLSFKTTIYDLIIEDLPEVESYYAFRKVFGSDEIIQIVVKAQTVYDPATFTQITWLSDEAARIAGVGRVISLPEVKKSIDPRGDWDLNKFKALLKPVTLFERNLISTDERTTIITLILTPEADKEAVILSVSQLFKGAGNGLHIYQIGIPLVSQALAHYSRQDFFYLTPFTLLVIALLLVVFYRRVHCIVLPLACVLLSVTWTFGTMAWLGISVTMLTLIVPVFLIAVGTAYCLYICTEYLDRAGQASSPQAASRDVMAHLALPMTLVVATTLVGIGSLATNNITTILEFSALACFGMLCLLVLLMTFFPAMLSIFPLPSRTDGHPSPIDRMVGRLLTSVVSVNLKHRKGCLIFFGLLALFCLVGVLRVRVETNPVAFLKPSTPVSRHFHDIFQDMSGSFPVNVVMAANREAYFEDPAHLADIAREQSFLNQLPGVDKTVSIADYLMLVNYVTNRFDPTYYTLPQEVYELRMLMNDFKILLGNDMLLRFMSPDYSRINIMMLTHLASSEDFLSTRSKILSHARTEFSKELSWEVTGLGMVIAGSSHLLTLGQVKSLSLSLVLIFVIMVVLFVSAKVGIVAVVPTLFPILVNFGVMGWLGISLSAATSLIAGVVIGLAVDDIIHYLVRYNLEFKKDLDKDRAMRDTIMSTGRPIVFTSVTISLGFAVLIFSHFQPTALFGLLMVITMMSALAGDLVLLPALMMHVELVSAWDVLKMIPSLGGVPPGMVHELNQPLNAIKVGSDFLKMMIKQGTPVQPKHLEYISTEISQQVERASRMIQRLSEVGQRPGFDKAPLQLNAPIHATLELLENQLKLDNIQLTLDLGPELPPILAHHNRLVQVIYNLIVNGVEAIAAARAVNGGDSPHAITIRTWSDKDRVRATVGDTGIGIPGHHTDRIFEPFFTTKSSGKGKGLGLSISHEIIRDCGGRISATSGGQGTTITLSFPVYAQQINPNTKASLPITMHNKLEILGQ